MTEYISPCMEVACQYNPGNPALTRVCRAIGETLVEAGGVNLLEVELCPIQALISLGPESDKPQIAALRKKLGVIWHGSTEFE